MQFTLWTKFSVVDAITETLGKIHDKSLWAEKGLKKMSREINGITSGMGGKWIERGLMAGVLGLSYAYKKATDEAGKFQAVAISFVPPFAAFGKSAAEATKFTNWLNTEAIQTAYTFEGLSQSAKQLFPNLGGDIDRTMKTMKMFEDAAAGNQDNFQRMSDGYSKGLLMGKFNMRSLNQIALTGVPIYRELARVMFGNVDATKQVMAASKKGVIQLKDVEQAFVNMTSKGGIFFGSAANYAKTFAGQMDILGESVNTVWRELGYALIPVMMDLFPMINSVIDSTKAWLVSNREMIKSGFKNFVLGVVDAFKWIYNNWDSIVTGLKIWIGTWAGLTAVNFILNGTITALKAIELLSGPGGWILLGIGLIAEAWLNTSKNTKEASFYVDEYGNHIDKASGKITEFGKTTETVALSTGYTWKNTWQGIVDVVLWGVQQMLEAFSYLPTGFGEASGRGALSVARYRKELEFWSKGWNEYGTQNQIPKGTSPRVGVLSEEDKYFNYDNNYGKGFGFTKFGSDPITSGANPLNVNASNNYNSSKQVVEINLTTDKGTEAKVVNFAGATPVKVTLNNQKISYNPNSYK